MAVSVVWLCIFTLKLFGLIDLTWWIVAPMALFALTDFTEGRK